MIEEIVVIGVDPLQLHTIFGVCRKESVYSVFCVFSCPGSSLPDLGQFYTTPLVGIVLG